jgi:hypothetical protein
MKIALDYDATYTLAPDFWNTFIELVMASGYDIRVVTIRDDRLDRTAPMRELEKRLPVIYTRGVAKRWYCQHFGDGFIPDVWVDDKPDTILANSTATPDFLVEWREARGEPA